MRYAVLKAVFKMRVFWNVMLPCDWANSIMLSTSSYYHSQPEHETPPPITHTDSPPTTYINYRGADKSLARPTSRCILFEGQKISFDASLVIYINSTNIPPIMIINRIYETQNLLSL